MPIPRKIKIKQNAARHRYFAVISAHYCDVAEYRENYKNTTITSRHSKTSH